MSKGNFEEYMAKLSDMSEMIKNPDITLEEALKCYENGMEYYKKAAEILDNAKSKMEIYGEGI